MRYREGHGPKGVPKAFTSQATLGLLPAQDFLRVFFIIIITPCHTHPMNKQRKPWLLKQLTAHQLWELLEGDIRV